MRSKVLPILLLMVGCNQDKHESFPSDWPTATYSNGHHLVENPGYSRPEDGREAALNAAFAQFRLDNGLWAVPRNRALDGLARGHAEHMCEHVFYGHVNPEGLGPTDRVRIIAPHTPCTVTENAWVYDSLEDDATWAKTVLNAFIASPPHHEALLFPADLVGIGLWRGPHPLNPATESVVIVMLFVDLR